MRMFDDHDYLYECFGEESVVVVNSGSENW